MLNPKKRAGFNELNKDAACIWQMFEWYSKCRRIQFVGADCKTGVLKGCI